jgi:hypothetical protein
MHNRFGILGVWSDIMLEDYERKINEMKANEDKTICTNICRPSKTEIVNIKNK